MYYFILAYNTLKEMLKMKKCKKLFCIFLSLVFLFIPFASYNAFGIEINDFELKIDSVLLEKLNDMEGDDSVDVSVWLTNIDKQEEEKKILEALNEKISKNELPAEVIGLFDFESEYGKSHSLNMDIKSVDKAVDTKAMQLAVSTKRKASAEVYEKTNNQKIKSLFNQQQINNDIIFKSKYTPNFVITLSKNEVMRIAESVLVDSLYYYDVQAESCIQSDDELEIRQTVDSDMMNNRERDRSGIYNFSTYQYEMTDIDYMRDTLGYTGENVKIGIYDSTFANSNSIDYFNTDNLHFDCINNTLLDQYTSHGNVAACIIAGDYYNADTGDSFVGAAPDADLYFASGGSYRSCLERLISQGVNLINNCKTFGENGVLTYQDSSRFIDHIVSEHNVTFISVTNNHGIDYVPNFAMNYNGIEVGGCTQSGDFDNISGYVNTGNLAFKPDITAPGYDYVLPCTRTTPTVAPSSWGGNSYAAPIVSGTVAQLCQLSSTLATNPRLMKSVLLSGSKINNYMNVSDPEHPFSMIVTDSNSTENKFSKKFGSGIVNSINSYNSYSNNYYSSGYIPYFTEYISTSKNINASSGDLIRISAVWDKMNTYDHSLNPSSIPDVPYESYLLYITTPDNTVYKALYYYDTKLLTSFIASQGGTYNIQLVRMSNTYNNFTNFGLSVSVQDNPLS